jgi:hypothetical protein
VAHEPGKRCIELIDRINALYRLQDGCIEAADLNYSCHTQTFLGHGECPPRLDDPWRSIEWKRGAPEPHAYISSSPSERQRVVADVVSRFPDRAAFGAYCLARAEANGCLHIVTRADADAYATHRARYLCVDCDAPQIHGQATVFMPALTEIGGTLSLADYEPRPRLDTPKLKRIGGKPSPRVAEPCG